MDINLGMPVILSLTFFWCSCSLLPLSSEADSTIKQGEFLKDGETILSPGKVFELGFFSPESSSFRYLGIWYKKVSVQTVVWVANRNSPVTGTNSCLTIGNDGNLMVLDQNGTLLWSSNVLLIHSKRSTATLTDSGNFVLSNSSKVVLWQSVQNPTDNFLPGTVLNMDSSDGENHMFQSWRSVNDPSVGNYSTGVDTRGTPQIMTWQGSKRLWRSGHWNGLVFLGVPSMRSFFFDGFTFDRDEVGGWNVTYKQFGNETVRFYIWWNGSTGLLSWNHIMNQWRVMQIHPANECEKYNRCGSFGVCTGLNYAKCDCIEGFEYRKSLDQRKWSDGCIRRKGLQCGGDGFAAVERVKLPDFADVVMTDDKIACKQKCVENCSCIAYAFVTGIRCMMWGVDLVDIEQFDDVGETLYVRLDDSELGVKTKVETGALITGVAAGAIVFGALVLLLWRFRRNLKGLLVSNCANYKLSACNLRRSTKLSTVILEKEDVPIKEKQQESEQVLQMFSFSSISAATNNFANENKLGQGGFGPVYKGTLPGGQEIAVKRLSRLSGQGSEEFKNEIKLIAKLQHINLVRLLGCSIEGEEKLLLYEYLPNKSLDFLLFDQAKLDWSTRYKIVKGIARGLLYLHRDSRLRIIHRDLKASNILLDEEMNPKISDFGMARIFRGDDNEANTVRVVGTYGYMSPEYAMEGVFSVKSDVYSFGVLLLEILSGRKNTSFRTHECSSLVGYSWDLWRDGRAMEMVDPSMAGSCSTNTVLRCIHVAMLCVQDSAMNRPTMSSVVSMLETEGGDLPVPRQSTKSYLNNLFDDFGIEGDEGFTELVGR